jgi:uncharacterized phage protein gp47/JayE
MPFSRPELSDLLTQVSQDIAAGLPGSDPLLRFSNLNILGTAQAGLAYLHYGYLDWIAQQSNPFTATGEFLEAWAALKDVFRLPTASASGTVTFTGTNGSVIPSGTPLSRGDGQAFQTTASGTIASGTVTVPATAVADPAGLLGAIGNTDAGSILTLGHAIAGVNSSGTVAAAFVGGADLEADTSLRTRMLLAYQAPAHGGDLADYQNWALTVPGVTRVWVIPHGFGAGTVVLYVMFDIAEAAHGGLPQGSDGTATGETRDVVATGDQLAVANFIFPLQPVTALIYVVAPVINTINFTISGIAGASAATKAQIASAIDAVFLGLGTAKGSTVALSAIEGAIASIPGTSGFVITIPAANIVSPVGSLPTRGTVTYI